MSDKVERLRHTLDTGLAEGESEYVDFKIEGYVLDTQEKKAAFIKDLLALSNMVESPGRHCHIFIGVERDPQGGKAHAFPGVTNHPDDADLQNLVRDWTTVPPPFNYVTFEHQGVSIGVYELKGGIHIPYVASRTVRNTLWAGVHYIRRGSRNDLATAEEIHGMVERRKLWQPSQAMVPQPILGTNLSPAEVDLLIAAKHANGDIHILSTDQTGPWVRAGRADYIDESDPAVAATFRDALEHLVSTEHVRHEGTKGTYYTLTGTGWALARAIQQQQRGDRP